MEVATVPALVCWNRTEQIWPINRERHSSANEHVLDWLCLLNHNKTEAINSSGQRSLSSEVSCTEGSFSHRLVRNPASFHKQSSRPQLDITANAGLRPFMCVFRPGSCVHHFYTVCKPYSRSDAHARGFCCCRSPEWFFTVWNMSSSIADSLCHRYLTHCLIRNCWMTSSSECYPK